MINNGNRTEWDLFLCVIIQVIYQQNEVGAWFVNHWQVWLQTELDHTKSFYQLTITITISKEKHTAINYFYLQSDCNQFVIGGFS